MDEGTERSEPALAVEDDNSALVGEGGQFVLLVGDVLQAVHQSVVDHRVVAPETLGMHQRGGVVVLHAHCILLGPHCINPSLPPKL